MAKASKTRASKQAYISPNQLTLVGFESPFSNHLNPASRWVKPTQKIPWDVLVNVYQKQLNNSRTGADGINPRVVIGSLIIKHMCDLSNRETVQQIQENMYIQYFIGKDLTVRMLNYWHYKLPKEKRVSPVYLLALLV